LGSIVITGAQIGRQQRSGERLSADDEKEYRHAFLIVEAKKGPGGNHPRHVLCAESDIDRDDWVDMLVRYVMGTYNEEPGSALGASPISTNPSSSQNGNVAPRSSTGSTSPFDSTHTTGRRPARGLSKDEMISKGPAVPINQLTPDASNAKLFQTPPSDDFRPSSPARSVPTDSPIDRQGGFGYSDAQNAKRLLERGQQANSLPDAASPLSSSLPTSASPLETASGSLVPIGQRANSSLGHYSDAQDHRAAGNGQHRKPFHPTLNIVASTMATPNDRAASPEKLGIDGKVKISAPINGTIIPAGYKFGGKDAPAETSVAANERRERAKSRSFWGFGRPNGKDLVNFVVLV
jgi:RalA-binding protein 1